MLLLLLLFILLFPSSSRAQFVWMAFVFSVCFCFATNLGCCWLFDCWCACSYTPGWLDFNELREIARCPLVCALVECFRNMGEAGSLNMAAVLVLVAVVVGLVLIGVDWRPISSFVAATPLEVTDCVRRLLNGVKKPIFWNNESDFCAMFWKIPSGFWDLFLRGIS